jgi:hypothetical protein
MDHTRVSDHGLETVDQLRAEDAYPTHIFVQAGAGALAGAVTGYLAQVFQQPRPKFIIKEKKLTSDVALWPFFRFIQVGRICTHVTTKLCKN